MIADKKAVGKAIDRRQTTRQEPTGITDGHLIEMYIALVEEGSLVRVGERLNTTQPTVRRRIAQLRETFGGDIVDELMKRKASGAPAKQLSARAINIYQDFKRIKNEYNKVLARNSSVFNYRSAINSFAISANRFSIRYLLPQMFGEAERLNAQLKFNVTRHTDDEIADEVVERLRNGVDDISLTDYRIDEPDVTSIKIYEDDWVVCANRDIADEPLTIGEFSLDIYRHIRTHHDPIDEALRLGNRQPRQVVVSGVCVSDVPAIAATSDMIGACPALCYVESSYTDRLRAHKPPLDVGTYKVFLSHLAERQNMGELQFLIDFIRKYAARRAAGRDLLAIL